MAGTTGTAALVPTTAERVRSVCVRADALLAVEDADPVAAPVCHLLADGSVAVAVGTDPRADLAGRRQVHAMLELADHTPLPLRERVRALVWIRGPLQSVPADDVDDVLDRIAAEDANPALLQVCSPRSQVAAHRGRTADSDIRYRLLRLTMESVVVADATGAESVPVADLLAARPDPLCAIEASWLKHLSSAHPEVIARLAAKLPPRLRRGRAHPLSVDRYGIWLRVEAPDADHDARLTFFRPVDDLAGLNRAVRALMGCPFANGLRARRS